MSYRSILIPALLSGTMLSPAFAAEVPAGTNLAAEQVFTSSTPSSDAYNALA